MLYRNSKGQFINLNTWLDHEYSREIHRALGVKFTTWNMVRHVWYWAEPGSEKETIAGLAKRHLLDDVD